MRNGRNTERPSARKASSALRAAASPAPAQPVGHSPRRKPLLSRNAAADAVLCLLLVAAVFAVFGQTVRFSFINFDDNEYVTDNREVRAGLTLRGLDAAFTRPLGVNWHPLTTLSHMLDCQVFGLWAGGHHLGSVVLHSLTAAALYLVLQQMTGRTARSAFAAMLFALHPLRVESVAWVAERKDVLSGLFFMLTLAAYLAYVRKPSSVFRILLLPSVFALGLMSKPMLVTVPFVLLLLDYWPLGRFVGWTSQSVHAGQPPQDGLGGPSCRSAFALLLEKLPLFILSACSCAITLVLQKSAMPPLQTVTLAQRIGNSLLAYVGYWKLFFWPFGLAVYYPYPKSPPGAASVVAAGTLLACITLAVWVWRRKYPCLIVGWLWYLVMLVPVIGLIQVGYQSMADRYTYLPMIGPVVALVWLAADIAGQSVNWRFACSMAGSLAVLVLAACAAWQTSCWRDDLTLWQRTLECTKGNYIAHLHLGLAWSACGEPDKAIVQYEEVLRDLPDSPEAHFDLAAALSARGQIDDAQRHYESALKVRPGYGKALNNLGMLFFNQGKFDAAATQFKKALEFDPDYAMAQNNLGIVLMASGQFAAAAERFRKAIALDPDFAQPHANLGYVLARLGQSAAAVDELRSFLRRQPDNPKVLSWLADAYAETGDYPAALQTAQAALQQAEASGQRDLAAEVQHRIALYRRSEPFRQ